MVVKLFVTARLKHHHLQLIFFTDIDIRSVGTVQYFPKQINSSADTKIGKVVFGKRRIVINKMVNKI